ncbi:hypothetical protein Lalb_Chr13g0293531 [Lupinus albus]|uniref:Uncharacterized protein n=1 Tax=Lupinus albus TaxID=3870 RepID=A0A6A4PHQ3_LUPAL|nr:hypothetical protein Lalb_Chr13g0293531 [Lupinus albus]
MLPPYCTVTLPPRCMVTLPPRCIVTHTRTFMSSLFSIFFCAINSETKMTAQGLSYWFLPEALCFVLLYVLLSVLYSPPYLFHACLMCILNHPIHLSILLYTLILKLFNFIFYALESIALPKPRVGWFSSVLKIKMTHLPKLI